MASSIISRGEGLLNGPGDRSALLQAGFVQQAFRRLVTQYPHGPSTKLFEAYIAKSADSALTTLSNAMQDTSYPLDRLANGEALMALYKASGNETYRDAFEALRQSINLQPRNAEGGLWYYVYPEWSYLDGMFSFAPFYARYTSLYDANHTSTAAAAIVEQLDLLWAHCRNDTTGLLVHGYDESRTAVWADPVTGASPHVWGRSLGWYAMALVETLEVLPGGPKSAPWRHLRQRFSELAAAIVSSVDPASGAWWQILDQPGREGNYIESSGSAMFVYSLLKGARKGYLSEGVGDRFHTRRVKGLASRAYEYMVDHFVDVVGDGTIGYNGTVSVCSLNSTASYEYYVNQPILYNSPLGSAAFVLASLEYENINSGSRIWG
ncbi:Six-hairpin glycosidase-like protein [Earliella scabrosa]|nr:Six-hairpin glycosidase-like protein [Earliella scabrosa]